MPELEVENEIVGKIKKFFFRAREKVKTARTFKRFINVAEKRSIHPESGNGKMGIQSKSVNDIWFLLVSIRLTRSLRFWHRIVCSRTQRVCRVRPSLKTQWIKYRKTINHVFARTLTARRQRSSLMSHTMWIERCKYVCLCVKQWAWGTTCSAPIRRMIYRHSAYWRSVHIAHTPRLTAETINESI